MAAQRSSPSGVGSVTRSAKPLDPRRLEVDFVPCAATASIFLYCEDTSIVCLHHDTLAIERRFERHKERILFVAVDNISERGAGRLVVSYDAGQTAIVWDLFTGDEIARFASYEPIKVAAWMKNGNVAFGNSQGNVILFEPSTSEHISARTIFDPITALAPASDCQTYAIGYLNGSILIVALQPAFTILHTLTTPRAPSPIAHLAWHASSTKQKSDMLATQTSDGDLRVWSISKPPTAEPPKTIRILKRSDNVESSLNWLAWSKNGRVLQYSDGETWVWDVRTKHISCEPIPTVDGVRGLANYGQGATLFTLGPNHTIQQYDVSHATLVKRVQYLPMLAPPVPSKPNQAIHKPAIQSITPHMPLSLGSDSGRTPLTLFPLQRSAKDMLSDENVRRKHSEISSPISSSSRSRAKFSSSISSNLQFERRNRSPSSYAASGTTFSAMSPSMAGRDSVFSGGSSIFPQTRTGSRASSGRRSTGSHLRHEYYRNQDGSGYMDLFPYTRRRLENLTYNESRTLDREGLSPDDLRRQMLEVVFGWDDDIEALIRDELANHEPGSTCAVLLSKWLGEVDSDMMAAAMNSGTSTSSDWMLLALSSMGGGQESMGKMGQRFVQKLIQRGEYNTSATILLGFGDYEGALEIYVSRRLYMEAILLTCLIFPSNWQRQANLVRRWGESVMENSQQQLAIRCFTCTGMNPPLWVTPSTRNESTASQPTPSVSSLLSPPISPPPPIPKTSGSNRMTTKNSSLKVITSFSTPGEAQFKFPGLRSDDCTPTNAPGITPIAESAVSPVGTPSGLLRLHSRNRISDALRAKTSGDSRDRLPSIGENSIDVAIPLLPRPSALPTPDNSGSEFETKSNRFESQSFGEDTKSTTSPDPPPLLLSSARYDPGSAISTKSSRTALPNSAFPVSVLPDPLKETFTTFAEKTKNRNGSRDRKPDGLQIQMLSLSNNGPSTGETSSELDLKKPSNFSSSLRSSGSLSGRFDARSEKSPSVSGQSWASAKSPATTSRSIDQYISSIDEATRRQKGTSRLRRPSREGRSHTGEHKSRSKNRGHERSEDRGRNPKYIQPAKRSPSSPVPMSPDDIHLYLDNPSTDSLNAQLADSPSVNLEDRHSRDQLVQSKDLSNVRSGSKVSGHSSRTVVRRSSPEVRPESAVRGMAGLTPRMLNRRQESPDGSLHPRGRSTSKNHDSPARSPSSPLPMSPHSRYPPRSEDEDDPLRFVDANRQRVRSRHRKRRERGTSSRRDKSTDGKEVQEDQNRRTTTQRDDVMQPPPPPSAVETIAGQLAEAFERRALTSDSSDTKQKKSLAAQELEARRESLARRPQAPQIPHPADLSTPRPSPGMRSHTNVLPSPTSRHHSASSLDAQAQRPSFTPARNDVGAPGNRAGAASVGPYGLPATPRAMRHPTYDVNQNESIPAVPELPKAVQPLQAMFHTGHPMRELPRSISAPAPEQQLTPLDLPAHPAFHKALRTGVKRTDYSNSRPIAQYRRRPSEDSILLSQAPVAFFMDETLQAADSTVQITTIEQPPLLPELQHLSSAVPLANPLVGGPMNDGGAHHSTARGSSGLGVISIAIDNQSGQQNAIIPDNSAPDHVGPPVVSRSNSNPKRGRSENFMNNIKGITDRLRSTSRGRTNTKSPQAEQAVKMQLPYESVPQIYF